MLKDQFQYKNYKDYRGIKLGPHPFGLLDPVDRIPL